MSGGPIRGGMRQLVSTLAFGGSIAALIILFGTRDLESYEQAFFSLARGTAVQAVQVLGHPVYTLAIGLGVRLPLLSSIGSSPVAAAAPFLPAPVTYWLLLTFSIGSTLLVVRHALEPLCGRLVTWVAAVLLFCSVPMVTYTLNNDWPDMALTYCCFVACVFAPHALLPLLAPPRSSLVPRVGALLLGGLMWGAIALSHSGYWPQIAATLVCASGVALCRSDYPWRDRLTAVALLATVSLLAVAPQAPDFIRELNVPGAEATAIIRSTQPPQGELIASNLFPFGDVGSRLPFSYLVLALLSLAIGLTSSDAPSRRLAVGATLMSVVLGIGATTLPAGSAFYSPSSIWTLRDSAAAFAILGAAGAVAGLRGGSRVVTAGPALAVLLFAALQGPAYAARLVFMNADDQLSHLIAPQLPDHRVWTSDMTPPGERAWLRGLPRTQGVSGERLALWPGARNEMRNRKVASTDFADAGYTLVTAWTKQRTMRGVIRPNEVLFNQSVELSPQMLCDATAVAFLQLRYLLTPRGIECAPWQRVPGVLVDDWLELAVPTDLDDRVRALPLALVSDRIRDQPALSADSSLLSALLPVSGTSLRVGPRDVVLELDDPPVAAGHALVLPVAYDPAWRASAGTAQNLGGLLALTGVDQPRLTLEFVPDGVALLRAVSMTVAQVLALLGFLGLVYVRPRVGTALLHES